MPRLPVKDAVMTIARMNPLDLVNTGRVGLLQGSGAYNVDRYP